MSQRIIGKIKHNTTALLAWSSRPYAERLRIAIFSLLLSIILPGFLWSWLHNGISTTRAETQRIQSQYEKALPLAKTIVSQKQTPAASSKNISALAAAQQVTRHLGLEDNLASIRPTQDVPGRDGVRLYLTGLNLTELVHLFANLDKRAGLYTLSCELTRRMDNARRVDLELVVAK
jgi:hypothetical protein